jgi:hypothetical protein
MDEWRETRDVIKTFDERLHDLRKYGFSFVTGLLTVQGLLLPFLPALFVPTQTGLSNTIESGLPDLVKIGVLGTTILLITILRYFDTSYKAIIYRTVIRAIEIERFLNFELTTEVHYSYAKERLGWSKAILYYGFEAAVLLLAGVLLRNENWWWVLIVFFLVITEGFFYKKVFSSKALRGKEEKYDWTFDRTRCNKGDWIRIMLTNLDDKEGLTVLEGILIVIIPEEQYQGKPVCKIRNGIIGAGTIDTTYPVWLKKHPDPHDFCIWSWQANISPGIYRIFVRNFKEKAFEKQTLEEYPMKIHVTENPSRQ